MDVFKITAIAVVGAVFSLILKEYKPSFAISIGIICALIILLEILQKINYVFTTLSLIASKLNFSNEYMETIIKITGVSYISRFGADVCRDAGSGAIATNVELAGKIIIVVLSSPILISVINLLLRLL